MLSETGGAIFVTSDNTSIIELVEKMLVNESMQLITSINPQQAAVDFDRSSADVVLLAFDDLDKAEETLQLLTRDSQRFQKQQHRTLTLCNKNDVQRAYDLCRKRDIDNYIVFWPLSFDPPRLGMTVHQAFNELADCRDAQQQALEMLNQTEKLAALSGALNSQLSESHNHVEKVERTVEQTEQDVYAAIAETYQQLQNKLKANGLPEDWSLVPPDATQIKTEFSMVTSALQDIREVSQQFAQTNTRHQIWADKLSQADESTRSILVVDDDEFQRSVMRSILKKENYRLEFACSGEEALQKLVKSPPDLILMDIVMPGVNGIETTRQIKHDVRFMHIPIVMITSHHNRETVVECLKAGAVDFVVKPYNRETLIAKVSASCEIGYQISHQLAASSASVKG
ncbi:PleD family two-component system response regulator [Pontibacterium sp.]|uniref:response regulator n=1 Tax=Pontibacterium sp. TaxID=2036026 RepID=UPI003562DA3B